MVFRKDPDARLDYQVDWSKWLATGETIAASAWVVASGITSGNGSNGAPAPTNDDTTATIWLFGGTAGTKYKVTNRITTNIDRINDRTIVIDVTEQ